MSDGQAIPLPVRVVLAHASVQRLAESVGVDLLHIKGPALAPALREGRRGGTDVDVIVRPSCVPTLMTALDAHGWRVETSFSTGSAFDHAATLYHPTWGLLDVHRTYPGMDRDPARAFEVLWAERGSMSLAHVPCPVPSPVAQSLVLLRHAARTRSVGEHPDVTANWTAQGQAHRTAVRALAERTGATVGLAAATGELDEHAGSPESALWEVFATESGDRLGEWRARWRSARGVRAKASVAVRSLAVNRYYLRLRLGHEPSPAEMTGEFVRRIGEGARALARRGGPR